MKATCLSGCILHASERLEVEKRQVKKTFPKTFTVQPLNGVPTEKRENGNGKTAFTVHAFIVCPFARFARVPYAQCTALRMRVVSLKRVRHVKCVYTDGARAEMHEIAISDQVVYCARRQSAGSRCCSRRSQKGTALYSASGSIPALPLSP